MRRSARLARSARRPLSATGRRALPARLERLEPRLALATFNLAITTADLPFAKNPYGLTQYDDTVWASAFGTFGATSGEGGSNGYLTWDPSGNVTVNYGQPVSPPSLSNLLASGFAGDTTITLSPSDAAKVSLGMRVSGGVQNGGGTSNAVGREAIVIGVDTTTGVVTLNVRNVADLSGLNPVVKNLAATGTKGATTFKLTNPADVSQITKGMILTNGAVNPQAQPINAFASNTKVTKVDSDGTVTIDTPLIENIAGVPNPPLNPLPLATGTKGASVVTLVNPASAALIQPGMLVSGGILNEKSQVVQAFVQNAIVDKVVGATVYLKPEGAVLTQLGDYRTVPSSTQGPVNFQTATAGTVTFTGNSPGPVTFKQPLPSQQLTRGQTLNLKLPVDTTTGQLGNVRMVFTVGGPGWMAVDPAGGVSSPTSYGDPYFRRMMFDFVEFTLNVKGDGTADTFFLNTSTVDQFGFPIQIQVVPPLADAPTTVGVMPTRGDVFTRYTNFIGQQITDPVARSFYQSLSTVQTAADGSSLRIMSPTDRVNLARVSPVNRAIPVGMQAYFDGQIDGFFDRYDRSKNPGATFTMTNVPGGDFSGKGSQAGTNSNLHDLQGWVTTLPSGQRVLRMTDVTVGANVVGNGWTYDVYEPFFSTNGYPSFPAPPAWLAGTTSTPTEMVFAGDGVFADNKNADASKQQPLPPAVPANRESDWRTLLGALENQVVTAFNRGVALNDYADWTYSNQFYSVPTQVNVNVGSTLTQLGEVYTVVKGMSVSGPGIQPGTIVTGVTPIGGGSTAVYTLNKPTLATSAALPSQSVVFSYAGVPNPFYGGTAATRVNNPQQIWNAYSQFLHQEDVSHAGLAYGFSYDDQGGFSSTLASGSATQTPQAATIRLGSDAVKNRPAIDLNGDGITDIIWRDVDDNGTTRSYVGRLYDAGGNEIGQRLLSRGSLWELATVGYFTTGPVTDLVWREKVSGTTIMWPMNADGTTGVHKTLGGDLDKAIETSGDYDGDGRADLIWRSASTGLNTMWLMNGTTPVVKKAIGGGLDWRLVQTAADYDANGDGRTDLIWRQASTSDMVVWLMKGTASTGNFGLADGDGWQLVATGNFDADGTGISDLLWRDTATGKVSQWLMSYDVVSGTGIAIAQNVIGGGLSRQVVQTVNYWNNSVVWQKFTGEGTYALWLMQGPAMTANLPSIGGGKNWKLLIRQPATTL
jgi:hypothetical protein